MGGAALENPVFIAVSAALIVVVLYAASKLRVKIREDQQREAAEREREKELIAKERMDGEGFDYENFEGFEGEMEESGEEDGQR